MNAIAPANTRPRPDTSPWETAASTPAADRLAEYLKNVTFNVPQIPVVNNVDVAVLGDPTAIKAALARQACNPVRWVEVIRHMAGAGVTHVAECGPGKVLSGMTGRIEKELQSFAITDPASQAAAMEAVK